MTQLSKRAQLARAQLARKKSCTARHGTTGPFDTSSYLYFVSPLHVNVYPMCQCISCGKNHMIVCPCPFFLASLAIRGPFVRIVFLAKNVLNLSNTKTPKACPTLISFLHWCCLWRLSFVYEEIEQKYGISLHEFKPFLALKICFFFFSFFALYHYY